MVFHELGAEVVAIGCAARRREHQPRVGATHPEALAGCARPTAPTFGIALDGDADRLQMVDGRTAACTTATSCST